MLQDKGTREAMANLSKSKLNYHKSIISTSENFIPTDELLSRLGSLHEELSVLVQGQADLKSLEGYRLDLINRKILKHKDNGIRAFAACCLSDILRLYAPDAPYTEIQLTEIFKLFLSQFEQLGDPDNGYYIQQTYLLTRLLEFRSIVLLTDLPTSNKLLEELFQIFYDDSKAFQPKLFKVIGGILGEVISEFDSVPMPVLKLIFNKFLTYNPDDVPQGLEVVSNCGYEVSLILCDAYSSRMSRHLTKYYSEILYTITNEEGNAPYEAKSSTLRTIEKLHKLISRLWETVPDLVSAVIGFIYHELLSDDEMLRKQATKLVGHLLTVDSNINFVITHQDTFNTWLSKIADISADVRQQWTQAVPKILSSRDDISQEISKGLSKTLIDSEYRVRKISVAVFSELPVADIWRTITNPSVYVCLLQLTREKNREVRELCVSTVAQFYSDSLNQIEKTFQNKPIWEIVDTIPSTMFELYYINDLHINEQVDRIIFEYLLPIEADDKKRVKRLLSVISHFSEKAFSSFFAFNKRQLHMSTALSKYVEFCQLLNNSDSSIPNNEIAQKLQMTIQWLASGLADETKAIAALEALKEIDDKRIYYLIKTCITNDVSLATLKNSMKELMIKLQDPGLFRKNNVKTISTIIPKEIASQVEVLLYRTSPLIYNFSNIPVLLDVGSTSSSDEIALKRKLLDDISKVNPTLFRDQVRTLKDIIKSNDELNTELETLTFNETLKTLYKISKTLKDQLDFEDVAFFSKLRTFSLEGDPIIAKYAIKLMALSQNAQEELETVKARILPLNLKQDKQFSSHVLVLAEIFKYFPHVLDQDSTEVVSYLIKEVLLANQVVGDSKKGVEWINDSFLNDPEYAPISSKLFALKLFTNKLRSISFDVSSDELAKAFTEKTVKLFFYLIASGGELISEYNKDYYPTPSNYQTKLRCCAGLQVLKLARIPFLNDFLKSSDVIKLINLVEDESLPVRREFLDRLKDYIANELISIKFLPLIFFTAYEPDLELKTSTKTWINYTFNKDSFRKNTFFERALPRLIHAIAHHPDIVEGLDSKGDAYLNALTTSIDYLLFYFDSVAAQENFSLLYYLAERVKNYQDMISDDDESEAGDKNTGESDGEADQEKRHSPRTYIYIIGEIAQMILLALKERKGWQHSAYPGKLNLPSDLFNPFATIQEAQASFKTYLPERYTEKLRVNTRAKVGRILHTSQTQRQKAQKRMLANEYHEIKKRPRRNTKATLEDENEDQEEDEAYLPSQEGKGRDQRIKVHSKKSLRTRKEVDYKDDEDNEDESGL